MKSSSDWLFFDGSERHALGATRWFGIPGDHGTIKSRNHSRRYWMHSTAYKCDMSTPT
jgi:hypothetical protein